MNITLFFLGVVVCLISGVISLFPSRPRFMKGIQWLVCGFGSICIGLMAFLLLGSGTLLHVRFWSIIQGLPASITIDPLSAFFILVLCAVFVPVCIFAHSYYRTKIGIRIHGALFALFFLSLVFVLSVDNSWMFLLAWEVMSLLSFGLVVYDHEHPHVRRAGFIYLAMTHLGTLFLIIAFSLMNTWIGSYQFSDWALYGRNLSSWQQNLIFALVLIGFGTKAGMVPFHVWLPRAHPVAPAPVSALMSAIMIKVGLYGLLRAIWDWFDGGFLWWGVALLVVGLVTALVGSLYLVINDDLKQLLAYSSVENMGILLMALGVAGISSALGNQALTILAFAALLLHTMNHAIFKSLLFLVSGSVQHGTDSVKLNELGGLMRRMPYTAAFFFIGAAALAAVPLLNGFIGEWLLFQSFIAGALHWPIHLKGLAAISIAGLGMVGALASLGMVKAYGTAFLAKPRTEQAMLAHESPQSMLIGMFLLSSGVVLGGFFPGAIWSWVNPVIERWFPGALSEVSILSVPLLAMILVVVIAFMIIVIRMMYGRSRVQRKEAWGCGQSLTKRMQYTATSLTYPTVMFLHLFYRPTMTKESDATKHIRMIRLELHIKQLIEDYLYYPVIRFSLSLSRKFREIQSGHIQIYLAYILITILILLFVYIF